MNYQPVPKYRLSVIALLALITISAVVGCGKDEKSDTPAREVKVDLSTIKERDNLKAIMTYSATTYFMYRGRPMGYEYELMNLLTNELDLDLEIVIARNLDSMFAMLRRGDGDIIAHGLTVTKERHELVAFTEEHLTTYQVLVQRLPENWRAMKRHEIEEALIRNPVELAGKKVHVRHGSSYFHRLVNLSEEIGEDIDIVIVPGDLETEDLIRMVANGEIEYTVSDHNIAAINETYYDNLDVETAISLPQRIAWAVRKSSPKLLKAVNNWLNENRGTTEFNVIYNKYFENEKAFAGRVGSEYYSKATGQISKYDSLMKEYSKTIGWDWRLLASMIYQESRFRPESNSWAGARGLMQLMPRTAKEFGAENPDDPRQSIKAGTLYLNYLLEIWEDVPDSLDKIKFMLASYNVGENHVKDAQRLAEKYNADPDQWEENVAKYLLLKSREKYYNDEVVLYGYCRGEEPYNYVREILDRYAQYKKVIPLN